MFSKAIVSSLLLAALANGLVFRRDDGYSTPLPTATPKPIRLPDPSVSIALPDPSISLSLPPLDSGSTDIPTTTPGSGPSISLPDPSITLSLPPLDPTGSPLPSISLPDPSITLSLPPLDPTSSPLPSISLPDPSISLSLPPLDPGSTGIPTTTPLPTISLPDPSISLSLPPLDSTLAVTPTPTILLASSLPSVVTTTVFIYPTECLPTGTLVPSPGPSDVGALPLDDPVTSPSVGQSLTVSMPGQATPLVLPPVRRRRDVSVVSQLRNLQQQVVNTWVDLGKGNQMVSVVGQLESIIAQATAPGSDGPALLKQAQSLVNN